MWIIAAVCAAVATGCVGISSVKYNVSIPDVPNQTNNGDMYCVIQIREDRVSFSKEDFGQSPESPKTVQARLEKAFPNWFTSSPSAVPIIVESRTSMLKVSETGWGFFSFLVSLCTLGIVPSHGIFNEMDFSTRLLVGNGGMPSGVNYHGTINGVVGNPITVNETTFPKSRGWKTYAKLGEARRLFNPTRFDQDRKLKLDAFCASLALAVQKLTPEERRALRENNEAWWLDAKLGNKRNRPVEVVSGGRAADLEPSAPELGRAARHRIVSQSWDAAARKGIVVAALATNAGRDELVSWIRDEYLPDYCQTLGLAVSADDPASASPATIRIDRVAPLSDGTVRLEFRILE